MRSHTDHIESARKGKRPANARGFSLSEMLVVVALIGIIVLAILPAFGDFNRSWRARSTADEMLAHIRGVRQMAISMHQDLTITFDPTARTYTYWHPVQKQTRTVPLPAQMKMVTNPTTSFAPVFRINGSVVNSSSPSVQAPTTNFVELQTIINSGRTDRYRFGFSAAGQISYTVTR